MLQTWFGEEPFHTWGRKKELGGEMGPSHTCFKVYEWVTVAAFGNEFGKCTPPLSHTHTYRHSAEIEFLSHLVENVE